jgi:hypothetical protein
MYCRFCWRWRSTTNCSDFNPILSCPAGQYQCKGWWLGVTPNLNSSSFSWCHTCGRMWLIYRLLPYLYIYALLLLVGEGTIWPVCDVRCSCIIACCCCSCCHSASQGIRALHVVCRLPAWCPAYNRQLLRHVGITCSRLRRACSMSLATPMAWAGSLLVAVYAAPPLLFCWRCGQPHAVRVVESMPCVTGQHELFFISLVAHFTALTAQQVIAAGILSVLS